MPSRTRLRASPRLPRSTTTYGAATRSALLTSPTSLALPQAPGNFARTRDKLQIWPADDFGRHSNPSACSSKSLSPTPPSTPTLTGKGKSIYRGKRLVLISASKYRIKASGFRKTSTSMNPGRAGSRSLRPASDLTQLSLRNAHPASLAGDGYLFPSPRYKV